MVPIDLAQFNWVEMQAAHDAGINFSDICSQFGINPTVLRRAVKDGLFKRNKSIYRMSREARERASERMKKMRSQGIGNLTHRKSVPCEKLKDILRLAGLKFEEEFLAVKGRLFRVDIAFPETKIGIEVNGNQHYGPGGCLKPYYQERHEIIEAEGWKLEELHYSLCYNERHVENLIQWLRSTMDSAAVS